MFNYFRRNTNHLDTSLFDSEQDMDLVTMFNEARTEHEIQYVARMSRARMRARRSQLAAARRSHQPDAASGRPYALPTSLMGRF